MYLFSSVQLYLFRVYQTGQESSYVEDESGMDASEDGSGEEGSSFGAGMSSLFLTSLELLYFSQFISVSYSRNEFCTNQESQIALEEPNHKCAQRCIKNGLLVLEIGSNQAMSTSRYFVGLDYISVRAKLQRKQWKHDLRQSKSPFHNFSATFVRSSSRN